VSKLFYHPIFTGAMRFLTFFDGGFSYNTTNYCCYHNNIEARV